MPEGTDATTPSSPGRLAGRTDGTEIYHAEGIELRAGNRIHWIPNDKGRLTSCQMDRVSMSTIQALGTVEWNTMPQSTSRVPHSKSPCASP